LPPYPGHRGGQHLATRTGAGPATGVVERLRGPPRQPVRRYPPGDRGRDTGQRRQLPPPVTTPRTACTAAAGGIGGSPSGSTEFARPPYPAADRSSHSPNCSASRRAPVVGGHPSQVGHSQGPVRPPLPPGAGRGTRAATTSAVDTRTSTSRVRTTRWPPSAAQRIPTSSVLSPGGYGAATTPGIPVHGQAPLPAADRVDAVWPGPPGGIRPDGSGELNSDTSTPCRLPRVNVGDTRRDNRTGAFRFPPPRRIFVTYVIAQPCVDVKDKACIEECPVDCIYEGLRTLYIHPDECVDCGACEPVCPTEAIFYEDDLPEQWKDYHKANVEFFDDLGSPGGAAKIGCDPEGPPAGRRSAAPGRELNARHADRGDRDPPTASRLPLGPAPAARRPGPGTSGRDHRPVGRDPGRFDPGRRSHGVAGCLGRPGVPAHPRSPAVREAIVSWYAQRRGVPDLDPAAVLPTIGSKELVAWLAGTARAGTGRRRGTPRGGLSHLRRRCPAGRRHPGADRRPGRVGRGGRPTGAVGLAEHPGEPHRTGVGRR
jgi:NAD-dependent dihydropyrimidine dehydrogenase PreA subunit